MGNDDLIYFSVNPVNNTEMKNVRKTIPKKPAHMQKVNDGFANLAGRLGYSPGQVNNLLSQGTFQTTNLTRDRLKLDSAYRGNWIVGRIIDSVAEDMTAAGIKILGETDPKNIAKLQKKLTDLGVWGSLLRSKKWARLYGGAIGVIQIQGQLLSTPLRVETIGKDQFTGISVYDRWSVTPSMMELIQEGQDMGLPMYYNLVTEGMTGIRIHHSRVLRDIGIELPYWEALREEHWGESVIERVEDRLMSFDTSSAGAANLVNKAYLRTISVEGLRGILAQGGIVEENLIKMFQYVRLLQSSEGLTIIDKQDDFNTNTYTFAGLSDVINQFGEQLSGATEIPLVRLFGQSPAGFSDGSAPMKQYSNTIRSKQEYSMRSPMMRILVVAYQSVFGKPVPEDFDFEFKPLVEMSDVEKSAAAKQNGETISKALADGVFDLPTAMKEMKQQSESTGIGTNITDEMIQDAIDNPPEPVTMESDPNAVLATPNKPKNPVQKVVDAVARLFGNGK